MKYFADLTFEAKQALLNKDYKKLKELMNANFDRRKEIFPISNENLEIIKRARDLGASAKFTGSGGCIIGIYEDENMYEKLEKSFTKNDSVIFKPKIFGDDE